MRDDYVIFMLKGRRRKKISIGYKVPEREKRKKENKADPRQILSILEDGKKEKDRGKGEEEKMVMRHEKKSCRRNEKRSH